MRARGRRSLWGLLALAACGPGTSPPDEELARRIMETAPARFVEPRLAYADAYAPCDGVPAPAGRCVPVPEPGTAAFDRLARLTGVVQSARTSRGVSLHLVGIAELAWHGAGDGPLERAVAALEAAVAEDGSDPRVATDLAAAYLVRARASGGRLDALRALDALAAVETGADAPAAARFNRALALERIGLWGPAAQAWTTFLARDSTSGWATEARRRRMAAAAMVEGRAASPERALEARYSAGDTSALLELATRHPRAARELAMERWIPRAASLEPGRLPLLERLGSALVDRSVSDVVADVRAAEAAGPEPLARLTRALLAFASARRAWRARRYDEAVERFDRARSEAEGLSPSLAAWSALESGSSHFIEFRYREAERGFDGVLDAADESRHPLQVGRAIWGKGLIAARTEYPERAWRHLVRAADLHRRAGESVNAAFLLVNAGEVLAQLGRPREAWPYRLDALAELAREPPSTRLHTALWTVAESAITEGLPGAATFLMDEDVKLARSLTPEWPRSEALMRRGGIRWRLGDAAGAADDFTEARRVAEGIENPESRARALADVWEWEGRSLAGVDPRSAAARLDSALAVHEELGNVIYVARIYVARARAHAALGRAELARSDVERGVRLIERQRATIASDLRGVTFGDAWQEIFDAAIAHEVREAGDPWAALDYAERSRRLFLNAGAAERPRSWADADGAPRPAPGTALIQYAVVDGVVLRWTVTRDARRFDELPVRADSLARLTRRFVDGLRRGAAAPEVGRLLGRILLPAFGREPPRRLVVVPDRFLNAVPFHALPDPATGRSLVEGRAVSISPGFAFHLSHAAAEAGPQAFASALLVGNPDPGRDPDARLVDLPGAEREVRALGALYRSSRTLVGGEATREALLAELDGHAVLHYAGHAFYDETSPDASHLALASANLDGPDRLYVRELAGRSFRRLRLAVLSACSSAAPTTGRGAGLWGLALPFLSGGVSTVVGSLWPVEDGAAAALSTEFHAELLAGAEPAEALHRAQRTLLSSPDPALSAPSAWAAFQVLGR